MSSCLQFLMEVDMLFSFESCFGVPDRNLLDACLHAQENLRDLKDLREWHIGNSVHSRNENSMNQKPVSCLCPCFNVTSIS